MGMLEKVRALFVYQLIAEGIYCHIVCMKMFNSY